MRIERHYVKPARIESSYRNALKEFKPFLESARMRPSSLTLLASNCSALVNCGSVLAPETPEIGQALRVYAQAYAALFAVAISQGQSVTVPLGDGPTNYENPKVDESHIHAGRWLDGYVLATICRDNAALKTLCSVPVTRLRGSTTRSPGYRYILIEALQKWHTDQPGVANTFIEAMRATEPNRADIADADYTLHIDVPLIECLLYAVAEQSEFGDRLAHGVSLHKKYWTKTEDQSEDWDGFLSFGLLAAASLAFRRHLPFDVDSEYIPMRWVKGEF